MQSKLCSDIDILLVEDNDADIGLCSSILDELGCKLHVARTLQAAWQELAKVGDSINLILLDLIMTNGSGVEFILKMKKMPELQHIFYAVLTGLDRESAQNVLEIIKRNDSPNYLGDYYKPSDGGYRGILETIIFHYCEMRKRGEGNEQREPREPREPHESHEILEPDQAVNRRRRIGDRKPGVLDGATERDAQQEHG